MKKIRQHAVEYVAGALRNRASIEGMDEACRIFQQVNNNEGFIIDYMPQGIPHDHWLRAHSRWLKVEGMHLTPEEMARAITLAKERL